MIGTNFHRQHASRWASLAATSFVLASLAGCTSSGDADGEGSMTGATSEADSTMSADAASASSTDASTEASTETGDSGLPCEYPAGATEPMALNEVIAPYSWPNAIRADGTLAAIDLLAAHCDSQAAIDWSPHDLLVFVSFPAW